MPKKGERWVITPIVADQIIKLGRMGLCNDEIARFLNVSRSTFNDRLYHEGRIVAPNGQVFDVLAALKDAREMSDSRVVESLYNRATGFEKKGVYYPPDTTACIFWLKNRQRQSWTDVQRQEVVAMPTFELCPDGEPNDNDEHQKNETPIANQKEK